MVNQQIDKLPSEENHMVERMQQWVQKFLKHGLMKLSKTPNT